MKTEKYEHHGVTVSVISELKGKHRQHCLCYSCAHFRPGQLNNCPIAQTVFETCKMYDLVTPVYECHEYKAAE